MQSRQTTSWQLRSATPSGRQTVILHLMLAAWHVSGIATIHADDWPRFRGPSGSAIATDSETVPTQWSPTANLGWKTALPGPGASSPIVVGDRVFVTCYSGYGIPDEPRVDIENLTRHLVCLSLQSGEIIWQQDVKASLPEDSYYESGVSSHGYASHTPCSDGTSIFCFFGKGGVYAFDLDGNKLWNAEVGKESDPPRWGSSSSPVLHGDTLIVTAAAESQSIFGFDKRTGEVKWRQEATGLDGMWGTPTLVKVSKDRTDLVMLVARELWGLDPETGKLRWYAEATNSMQAYTSVVPVENRIFAFSGQGGGSVALNVGGSGNVTNSRIIWKSSTNAIYSSPVFRNDKVYILARGVLSVLDAENGTRLQQIRLRGTRRIGSDRFGALNYASPVAVGNRLFAINASGQMYVFQLGDVVKQLAVNEMTSDQEVFWGSPAISKGRMLIRGSRHLYCILDKHEPVSLDDSNQAAVTSVTGTDPAPESSDNSDRPSPRGYARRGSGRSNGTKSPGSPKRPARPKRPESAFQTNENSGRQ